MKMILTFLAFLFSMTTFAESRVNICHYQYKHDIFSADLQLSFESDKSNPNLRMDTPTPYGIRVYQYTISKIECGADNSLKLEGVMSGSTKPITFAYPTKDVNTGTLTYFDFDGNNGSGVNLECSADVIKAVCSQK